MRIFCETLFKGQFRANAKSSKCTSDRKCIDPRESNRQERSHWVGSFFYIVTPLNHSLASCSDLPTCFAVLIRSVASSLTRSQAHEIELWVYSLKSDNVSTALTDRCGVERWCWQKREVIGDCICKQVHLFLDQNVRLKKQSKRKKKRPQL